MLGKSPDALPASHELFFPGLYSPAMYSTRAKTEFILFMLPFADRSHVRSGGNGREKDGW